MTAANYNDSKAPWELSKTIAQRKVDGHARIVQAVRKREERFIKCQVSGSEDNTTSYRPKQTDRRKKIKEQASQARVHQPANTPPISTSPEPITKSQASPLAEARLLDSIDAVALVVDEFISLQAVNALAIRGPWGLAA